MSTRLRVAMDARCLQSDPLQGVGRSLSHILERLASEVDLELVTDARLPPAAVDLPQHALRAPPRAPGSVWLQWSVARWLRGFDGLFHGPFYAIPIRTSVPAVVTIHDLSFEVHPEDFGGAKRWVFRRQARAAAQRARRVLTVSEYAKEELVEQYRVERERIVVAPHGIDPRFHPGRADDASGIFERLGVQPPYIVALGGARRRGLEVAIGAWRRLRAEGSAHALVVVGSSSIATEPGLADAGVLSDDDWTAVLAAAAAFCYPTRYEGYGLPAAESVASGTPVVCARVGPLPEVVGDAAEWCDNTTEDAIADGLRRLLGDPARALRLRERGLEVARHRSGWDSAAEAVLRAYREAAIAEPSPSG